MDHSGNPAQDGVVESIDTRSIKNESSPTSATDDHSLPNTPETDTSPAEEQTVAADAGEDPAAEEPIFEAEAGEMPLDYQESEPDFDPQTIFYWCNHIFEVPKEDSFEAALANVQLPGIECGVLFGLVIRLFTDNNSFKPSVYLTGEPTVVNDEPDVFIRTNFDEFSYGDAVCIWGAASRPGTLEITIPYAVLDPQQEEPVECVGTISLNVVESSDPNMVEGEETMISPDGGDESAGEPAAQDAEADATGSPEPEGSDDKPDDGSVSENEVRQAFLDNSKKADGLQSLPRWSREGDRYEGECDISEFLSFCNGETTLCGCDVISMDSQEPVAGMEASINLVVGKLRIAGVPAGPGLLMLRFLYSNGQQVNLNGNEVAIEIVPSSFFERVDELVDTFQKMTPKQAMAGNSVRQEIPLPGPFDPEHMSIVDLETTDPDLSAVYNREKKIVEITGTPGSSGAISLSFTLVARTEQGYEISRRVKNLPLFELCSDTKSLWKNLPADSSAPYQAQDEEHAIIEAGARTILAASKRGRTHAHHGKFRDDNFKACYIKESGWFVVAVSDGAGSAQYSREGSRIICDTFCGTMHGELSSGKFDNMAAAELEDKLKTAILDAAHQGLLLIEEEAKSMSQTNTGVTAKDYSATFLGYVMKHFEDGWLIVSIGIGDGVIGLLDQSNQVKLLSCPDHGEFSGQTRFLTTSDVWNDDPLSRTAAVKVEDFKAIFSMSDGVSDPKFETENDMNDPEFWVSLWDEISRQVPLEERSEKTAGKLSEWLDFVSRGYNDDRTIVLVY